MGSSTYALEVSKVFVLLNLSVLLMVRRNVK